MKMWLSKLKTFLLISVSIEFALSLDPAKNDSPNIVNTQQGSLEGLTLKSRDGKPYYTFRGIPYAEFPGRFEIATSHASWDGVRSAKEYGNVCAQYNIITVEDVEFLGSEEEMCLYLNVATPTLDTNANLPVLFWIHGGGYIMGSGDGHDGKYFVDENVIVVSINYRLGAFGFLSFDEENESIANIGLKDQLLALKWVSKNIRAFGGDESKITIGGFSAGASSVNLHILSEQSSGLFRAAISHSGTASAFWAMQKNAREIAIKLASILECPVPPESSTESTRLCLKTKSVKEITLAQAKLRDWQIYPICNFGPVIETKGKDSFISELPETILQDGRHNKVNWIVGFTEDEAAMFDIPLILNSTLTETLDDKWEEKAPLIMGYEHLPRAERDLVSKQIRDHYFGQYDIEEMTWSSLRNMFTDRFFLEPLVTSIELHSQHKGRVYPYIFRFTGDFSVVHKLYGLEGEHGVSHGDDLQYLFPGGGGYGSPDYSGDTPVEVVEFSRKFVKLWASFIKKTIPTVTWGNENSEWKNCINYQRNFKSNPFYEIAIETGRWDEDISSRLKVWQDIVAKFDTKRSVKSEL